MIPEFLILAQSGGEESVVPVAVVVTILTAVISAMLGKRSGEKSNMTLEPNPLNIQVNDQFVTRREYDSFRAQHDNDIQKLENMMERSFENTDRKHLELLTTIEAAAKNGLNGRVALWDEVNKQGREQARQGAQLDVAAQLQKVLKSIEARNRHEKQLAAKEARNKESNNGN